jgi:hypothetical protein
MVRRQADPLKELADFRFEGLAAANTVEPKRQCYRVSNAETWIERRERVLEHQLQIATVLLLQRSGIFRCDVTPSYQTWPELAG